MNIAAFERNRHLRVEDILPRERVELDDAPVRRFLKDKCVLVTGAGGSIGSELCRQALSSQPSKLILLDRYENGLFQIRSELDSLRPTCEVAAAIGDITDESRMQHVFRQHQPNVVFHAAAHKHVPLMEENPCEAVKNNVRGTRIAAECAIASGVERFVFASTDKAVNPCSILGATKRVGELLVERFNAANPGRFVAVRFGNVLASNGSVIHTFLAQIERGGPVTVTHPEMRRFFMSIGETVQLVLHAGASADPSSLFVLELGDQVLIVDIAKKLIRMSGLVPDEDITVSFIGVRAGEKLYEELVATDEESRPSSNPHIFQVLARNGSVRSCDLDDAVAELEHAAQRGHTDDLRRAMARLVPSFANAAPRH